MTTRTQWGKRNALRRQAATVKTLPRGSRPADICKAELAARGDAEFRRSGGKRRRSSISIGDLQATSLATRTHIAVTLPRLKFMEGDDG